MGTGAGFQYTEQYEQAGQNWWFVPNVVIAGRNCQAASGTTCEDSRSCVRRLRLGSLSNVENPGIKDWQIRQAIDAVLIYKHQFRKSQFPEAPSPGLALDAESTLEKARQFASLKKYARSTRKNYLAWINR